MILTPLPRINANARDATANAATATSLPPATKRERRGRRGWKRAGENKQGESLRTINHINVLLPPRINVRDAANDTAPSPTLATE
jgi:hypothetical protein